MRDYGCIWNDVTSDVLAGKNTNEKYQLEVTASSAYVVKKFELIAGGTNDQVKDVADSDNDKNPDSHRYSTTVKFELPAKTDINAQLDSMYLNVIDGNAQKIRYPQDASKHLVQFYMTVRIQPYRSMRQTIAHGIRNIQSIIRLLLVIMVWNRHLQMPVILWQEARQM